MKYRIYIDEVGNPDLESSDNPNHRFLSLTGVIMELGYVEKTVHPQMEELKCRHFPHHPDEPIILHRSEILKAQNSFRVLKDPERRLKFDEDLMTLLNSWDYTLISVCIDKKKHKETYTTWRYDPYHYCLAVMLERFVFFLNRCHGQGDAMAESRGGNEDRKLKNSFARLWTQGTDQLGPDRFQSVLTSKELKVKLKASNICGLQLADLVAHPSRNEILNEQGLLGKEIAPFAREIITLLKEKYYRDGEKVFGKKFL